MPLYFLLGTLTEHGQKLLHGNSNMVIDTIKASHVEGAEILVQYAVLGKYDFVMMAEADDNEAVARLSLEMGVRMGMHIETLPAMAIGVLADDERGEGEEHRYASAPSSEGEADNGTEDDWRLPGRRR